MKKIFITSGFLLASFLSFSQEITPNEGLRYAFDNLTGSARFRAMSGAFGAVGGDLSAINVNPAGSALFNYNQATISLSNYNVRNSSSYFGTRTIESDHDLDINQAGGVFVFKNNNPSSGWNKFSIALNYENNSNFDNQFNARGVNPNNSIDGYFLRFANGLPNEGGIFLNVLDTAFFDELSFIDQQALLGYNAYMFNPVDNENPDNSVYVSNVPTNGNYYQENYTVATGYNGKITGNIATSFKDRLFIGLNLNAHFTDLTNTISIYESYNNNSSTGLRSVQFDTETYTFGGGFSFGIGAIGKITESVRLGLAYESPTWYNLTDEVRQRTITYCEDCDANSNPIVFDPNVIMVFDSYKIQTPSKLTGSFAYVFGERGLISIDYSMKDYSNITFRPRNDVNLESINNFMSANLDTAAEIRVGGEFRHKQWSLRGGYRFEESPYKVDTAMGDLTGYSGGIGFDFGISRLDLAYAYSRRKMNFDLISSGLNDTSRLTAINNNVTLSYTIKF
ncbi:outer membrane protein transport protein [Flavobacterium piscinae]|uniref:Transporter n=1 Tax=Flavobacterium piscinae TaxID=2506424 RepID=A0A4Q1KLL4_9FLAO|nr:outer membrane protein transport protein [Flavobacterium piscinae]MBC8884417.1 outer membrane protein transport protein [Flavobacterium piscinae]RXR30637.1 transporter [Flavobacterium piscinae]